MPGGDVGYDEDPEGLTLASTINQHLPSTVRVGVDVGIIPQLNPNHFYTTPN